jgi:hypothetical protein
MKACEKLQVLAGAGRQVPGSSTCGSGSGGLLLLLLELASRNRNSLRGCLMEVLLMRRRMQLPSPRWKGTSAPRSPLGGGASTE